MRLGKHIAYRSNFIILLKQQLQLSQVAQLHSILFVVKGDFKLYRIVCCHRLIICEFMVVEVALNIMHKATTKLGQTTGVSEFVLFELVEKSLPSGYCKLRSPARLGIRQSNSSVEESQ